MAYAFRVLLIILIGSMVAWADGQDQGSQWAAPPDTTPNQASDASFDKRLPPVLPGETVKDSGKKMKMWSTSGPVPVSQPPEPFQSDGSNVQGNGLGHVGVVIDGRRRR